MKIHSSCEIEDFVEPHLCKLCVILRSRALRVVCPDIGRQLPLQLQQCSYQGQQGDHVIYTASRSISINNSSLLRISVDVPVVRVRFLCLAVSLLPGNLRRGHHVRSATHRLPLAQTPITLLHTFSLIISLLVINVTTSIIVTIDNKHCCSRRAARRIKFFLLLNVRGRKERAERRPQKLSRGTIAVQPYLLRRNKLPHQPRRTLSTTYCKTSTIRVGCYLSVHRNRRDWPWCRVR